MIHLQRVFTTNNYPSTVVTKCLNKIPKPRDANNTESSKQPAMLITPYITGLSERLERKCRNLDIKLVFRSGNTLRSQHTHVKNRIDEEQVKGVVYSVECGCGEKYIGETGRTMNLRMKEHQRAVKYDNTLNGISVHANTSYKTC